ncbi:MAG: response regulator transcription factor [Clostridia bacterium]|nr:response regulator transcription factor [Clostridia bacterium]
MKILIIDDEVKLADAIGELFRQHKYVVDVVYDGEDGLYCANNGDYDVVLLDVMMPNMDGFEVIKKLRESKNAVPVIMLTAKDDLQSKVKGLDLGADDYLPKPFAMEELLARVRALARRHGEMVVDTVCYRDVVLNTSNYTLHCGDKSVSLGAKEYNILYFMLTNPKQVLSKDMIISKVWGLDCDITENDVEAYMSFLRKKLSFVGSKLTILSKRMLGYYLETDRD